MRSSNRFASPRVRWSREEGQTMPEYGVVLGTVVLGCLVVYAGLTGALVNLVTSVVSLFP